MTLENRNYSLAAGVNLFVVLFGTTLWMLVRSPVEIRYQRLLIACELGILWLLSNELGTYKIMPRSSTTLDQLDQCAALAVAILLVLFSWSKELRDLVERFKNHILVNKRAGSLSSLGLVGLIDSIELSSQAELAERAELTTWTRSVGLIGSVD